MRVRAIIIVFLGAAPLLAGDNRDFWAFRHLVRPAPPPVSAGPGAAGDQLGPIDRFLLTALEAKGLAFAPEADRRTLMRRAYLDLIGLPPAPEEVSAFAADPSPGAYRDLIDRLLASPRHGERWGRQWLDVAGYSDSNGYHRNDTPRPLAYRYRDYVIKSFNEDKPYDRFLLEQLAGDELVDYHGAAELDDEAIAALTATHFLRNAPDGTDSTEGNETARTIERYAVLEGGEQIAISSMFGLTIDCARCHDHKFDPIPQRDYYALQAVFYPAFNVKSWTQPKDRWIHAAGRIEIARWQEVNREVDAEILRLKREFEAWLIGQPPRAGAVLFEDAFSGGSLAANWSDTAPGDAPAPDALRVKLEDAGVAAAPAARIEGGRLEILAQPAGESVWLSTRRSFDWTPEHAGGWIQATFELAGNRLAGSAPAERIGFYIALHDHDDKNAVAGGNILLDGNPAGGAAVHLDYPGKDTRALGEIGASGYKPGRRYGVRVTRTGDDEYLLAQVVDGHLEEKMAALSAAQLPDGGFGFELCCGRSFAADHVVIEGSADAEPPLAAELRARREDLETTMKRAETKRVPEPARIAWVTDLSPEPPSVQVLERGDYFRPGTAVEPAGLSALAEPGDALQIQPPFPGARTTGRRLAFARWATKRGSRTAALLARVEANRIWMGHFGRGIVETPENFGLKGTPPAQPELLEWLAVELTENGWSRKRLHREILLSRAYRQRSSSGTAGTLGADSSAAGLRADPDNRLLWQFPPRRLEAEVIRDAMLFVAGALHLEMGGPPMPFLAREDGQVVLPALAGPGPHAADRRSVYIQHRRSQPLTFLQVFDLGAEEPNCPARSTSAVVSQALAMLNGELALRTARSLAERLEREAERREDQVGRAFEIALARPPSRIELERVVDFLDNQARLYTDAGTASALDAARQALADFCGTLLAANEFAYLQ